MAIATKTSLKKCIAALNFNVLIPSRLVRLNTVSKFRKRKRKSLYCVFALLRALSCRSHAVTAKNCSIKECCTCKVVVKTCAFLRPQRGFSNRVLRKKLTFTSIEPELHVSTPYEFLVSVHTTSFLGFSPSPSYGASNCTFPPYPCTKCAHNL